MDANWTSSRHYGRHGDINGFWILMNDDLGAALLQGFYQLPYGY